MAAVNCSFSFLCYLETQFFSFYFILLYILSFFFLVLFGDAILLFYYYFILHSFFLLIFFLWGGVKGRWKPCAYFRFSLFFSLLFLQLLRVLFSKYHCSSSFQHFVFFYFHLLYSTTLPPSFFFFYFHLLYTTTLPPSYSLPFHFFSLLQLPFFLEINVTNALPSRI